MEKEETPILDEDLGIVVGSESDALWKEMHEKTKNSIKSLEKELEVQRAVLEMSRQKVAHLFPDLEKE